MKIEIYSRSSPYCPYCVRAKSMIEQYNQTADIYDVSVEPSRLAELKTRFPAARTFPVVVIDGNHIGGSTDLRSLLIEQSQKAVIEQSRKAEPEVNVLATFNGMSL